MFGKTDTPEVPRLQMRAWKPEDYDEISAWWKSRAKFAVPLEWLPPSGWIMERDGVPVAVMFAFCAVGIGIAHIEWIAARPGQNTMQTREALHALFEGVKRCLAAMDYGIVIANCPAPIARDAARLGMQVCSTANLNLIGSTRSQFE